MTNTAPARTRRPRTAAGSTPPMIARDIAQIASLALEVPTLADCCEDLTGNTVLSLVLPSLRTHLEQPNITVVMPALIGAVLEHFSAHTAAGTGTDGTWTTLDSTNLAPLLAAVWHAAHPLDTLEDTIAAAVDAGLDGELLCWEVITRESTRHTGLIRKEAGKLARILPDGDVDDLIGHGWHGLRVALRQYNPALGYTFSTYACPRINGAIRDGVRKDNPIPKRLTTFVRAVTAAEESLTQSLARTPSLDEISSYLKSGSEHLPLLPRLTPSASLEEMTNPWGEMSREPACLVDATDPQDLALSLMRNSAVRDAVDALPADEARAVRMLFLEEIPIGEAATAVGVDTRTLRAAKNRGLTTLANTLAMWAPDVVPA